MWYFSTNTASNVQILSLEMFLSDWNDLSKNSREYLHFFKYNLDGQIWSSSMIWARWSSFLLLVQQAFPRSAILTEIIESKSIVVVAVDDWRDTVDSTDSRRETGWCGSIVNDDTRRVALVTGSGNGIGGSVASTNSSSFSSDDSSSSGIACGEIVNAAGFGARTGGTGGIEETAGADSLLACMNDS
ncbi:hypothetical protein OGAPHI_001595 [Ogataea philodendri]|uniref:Uncharacterized protein n=1 Tax=Ogataea philodendri TaxID=1378263 RepID=A0A9P8PDI1_9ASCO|nr:uncharacterized protein OGAPHI_001595 [Ogataea philodendri]KAH3669474.1 hypothetical protein OGAPHI_001595 [Ogataea philodendri]